MLFLCSYYLFGLSDIRSEVVSKRTRICRKVRPSVKRSERLTRPCPIRCSDFCQKGRQSVKTSGFSAEGPSVCRKALVRSTDRSTPTESKALRYGISIYRSPRPFCTGLRRSTRALCIRIGPGFRPEVRPFGASPADMVQVQRTCRGREIRPGIRPFAAGLESTPRTPDRRYRPRGPDRNPDLSTKVWEPFGVQ